VGARLVSIIPVRASGGSAAWSAVLSWPSPFYAQR